MATNLGTLTLNLLANTGSYIQGLSRAERQTRQSTENMSQDYNLVGKTIGELKNSVVGYMAGIVSVGAAIAKMDSYTGLQNRLKLVTTSQAELNQAMQDTFSIAQATGQSWDSTAQVYQRFADNAKRLGITFQETAVLTDTVARAIAISGGSAASAEAALVQFGQALASGVLRGEEFNSISEQAPGLLKAIATGLNVNIGELRKMANEGELTADVVIKSLNAAKSSVDTLFGKTDFTIGMSFTQLNNALTEFVGEAGKSSGGAQLISGSIQGLAANLDAVTNVAMVGTAFYVGSYIPALSASVVAGYAKTKQLVEQAAVQYATIQAERVAAAQALINAETVVVNTQATLAALAAEKALEVERLKAQINQAGRIAAATRMAQLRRIEVQVTAELTAAESALAAARARSAAATATSARVGAGLLGILGGPVGLGLTVAGVAASYLLMRDNAEEVNQKLIKQASVADIAASELSKLHGTERKSAINDLTAAFEAQNKELNKSEMAVGSALINIQNYAQGNVEVARISNEARLGTISYTDAVKQLNNLSISPELYNALKDQVAKYDENYTKANKSADALKVFGKETVLAGNAAQNAIVQHQSQADAMNNIAAAADKASEALSKYRDKQKDSVFESLYKTGLMDQGYNSAQAQAIYDVQAAKGNSAILSQADKDSALNTLKIQEQYKAREEAEKEAAKKIEDAAKKRESDRKKAADDAKKLREQQFQDREDIYYKYASREMKIEQDLQKEISKIQKSNFSPKDSAGYIQNAQMRSGLEIQLYQAQLDAELNDWKSTEQEKLNQKVYVNELMIQLDADMNDKQKQQAMQSLIARSNQELAWMKLEEAQRISDAGEALRTDLQNIEIKYAFERKKIEENAQLSDDERQKRLALSFASEDHQNRQNLKNTTAAWGGTFADLSGTGEQYRIEQDRFSRYDESQALFDAQMALADSAAEREAIWQAHNDRMLAIDKSYADQSQQLNFSYGEQIAGAYADMFKTIGGEQSAAYKTMFVAQKAFAIAQSMLAIQSGIAQAAANPFPMNLVAMASVAAATAGLISNIQSVAGVFHGGTDYVPKESSYLLDKGERVLSPRQNTDLTRYLSNQRQSSNSGAKITINNSSSSEVNARQEADGTITVDVVENMIKRSWQQLGNANSRESKSLSQNTNSVRRR